MTKKATAYWFDQRNGEKKQVSSFEMSETREVVSPNGWEDSILVLKAGE